MKGISDAIQSCAIGLTRKGPLCWFQVIRWEIREGRFQRAMAIIAAFSAIVSGFEAYMQHLRGAFANWLMWTPVLLAVPTVLAAVASLFSEKVARTALPAVSLVSLADGVVGFIYHVRGIRRLAGGFKVGQYNVVMGPPIFAPLLLCTVGILGFLAGLLRREVLPYSADVTPQMSSVILPKGIAKLPLPLGEGWGEGRSSGLFSIAQNRTARSALHAIVVIIRGALTQRGRGQVPSGDTIAMPGTLAFHDYPVYVERLAANISHGRFQQGMALTSAFLALLAGGEVYFEHLRGSFNQRIMWTPVWVTAPMVIGALGAISSRRVAQTVLPIVSVVTFLDGLLGFLLHLRGIKRMPGGFSNLEFNITLGPPLFAPLLFTASGLLGLIAVLLRRGKGRGLGW